MKNPQSRHTYARVFFIVAGCIAVILGAISVVVPGLPTTPLVLLASWCFYKSSPRLRAWLLQSFLGKYIRDYKEKGGLTTRKRLYIIALMATMVSISIVFFIPNRTIDIIVGIAGLIGCIVVGFVVPKAKEKKQFVYHWYDGEYTCFAIVDKCPECGYEFTEEDYDDYF